MKQFLYSGLALLFSFSANAQMDVTFEEVTPPCDSDGVVVAHYTGPVAASYTYHWHIIGHGPYLGGAIFDHISSLTTDTITNFPGGMVQLTVSSTAGDSTFYYNSNYPFTATGVTIDTGICPMPTGITLTFALGTPPYTVDWYLHGSGTFVASGNPAYLPEGGYDFAVTDAAGCQLQYGEGLSLDTPVFTIVEDQGIYITLASTVASCTNGTATVTSITGGTPPYTYLWNTGDGSSSIDSLMTDYYSVTVTDSNGCHVAGSAYVSQTPMVYAPVTSTPATCTDDDGAVIAFPSGGLPPYTFLWSNGAVTQSQSGLLAGEYDVTVLDANGCIGFDYGLVVASTPISVTYSSTASTCNIPTGSATLSISGGLAPYTVTWYTYTPETGLTADSLAAGPYGFLVTDANGCVQTGEVYIPPITILYGGASFMPATCSMSDGAISLSVYGTAPPFTFLWSTGDTTSTINGIPFGYYTVTVTDDSGCSKLITATLPYYAPISIGITETDASCIYTPDGTLTAAPTGGTAPYSYAWTSGSTTTTASGLASGYYSVTVNDAAGCHKTTTSFVGYDPSTDNCYCTITGTVYTDANANCIQDPGENGITNIGMHLDPWGWVFTDTGGHYSFQAPNGSYTLSQVVQTIYPLAPCQTNYLPVSVTAASGCTQTFDFADTLVPIHDMHISTVSIDVPQPGYPYNQKVILKNDGTVTETNIVAGYNADGQIFAPVFVPSLMFLSAGGFTYDMPAGSLSLAPGAYQDFILTYDVPVDIPLSTSLLFKDSVAYTDPIDNWLNDYTPWNNVNYYTDIVEGSFDPNSKEVLPAGIGPSGNISTTDSVLEYTIHFQNLGTIAARNIRVIDTLDADLDWNTFRVVYTSHPCEVTISEAGVASFQFKSIYLPPKYNDELNSNGQVIYSIKQKPSLADGTQIKNTASIYFDFNQPVATNTTLNTLGPLGVQHLSYDHPSFEFNLFPNPANNSFQIALDNKQNGTALMEVANVAGTILMQQTFQLTAGRQSATVNVSALAPGIYFVTMGNNSGRSTKKLVIVK